MLRFENKICPVCRAPFNKNADVVVCPACGTPHHRACYLAGNRCALEELHASGFVWKGRLPDEEEAEEEISVSETPGDGLPHPLENPHSSEDSARLEQPAKPENADHSENSDYSEPSSSFQQHIFENFDDDPQVEDFFKKLKDEKTGDDGVSMRELISFTASSIWHYSMAFNAFRGLNGGKKRKVFFNFFSGILAPIFQFYRKMNVFGVVTLVAVMLPMLVLKLLSGDVVGEGVSEEILMLLDFILIATKVLLCLFGDYFYYKHAVRQIRKVRADYEGKTNSLEYYEALSEKGRPSYFGAVLGILAQWFALACIVNIA